MPGGNIGNAKDDNEESRMGTATGREDLHPRLSGRVRPLLGPSEEMYMTGKFIAYYRVSTDKQGSPA
jgi:hypothetical protein